MMLCARAFGAPSRLTFDETKAELSKDLSEVEALNANILANFPPKTPALQFLYYGEPFVTYRLQNGVPTTINQTFVDMVAEYIASGASLAVYCVDAPDWPRGGGCTAVGGGGYTQALRLAECVRALKGLALPRASHSSEIALSGSRRLRSTLAAAPVLFAHAVVTEAKNRTSATPT